VILKRLNWFQVEKKRKNGERLVDAFFLMMASLKVVADGVCMMMAG